MPARNLGPKTKPSIRDVAEAAGVSRAAVSLVLNGGPIRIGQEKRQRIIDVAREMGYTPHVGARRLALRRMETLGLVLPTQPEALSEYNLFELTHAIAIAAREHSYDLLLHFYDPAEQAMPPDITGRADGSILVLGRKEGANLPAQWAESRHPHVIIGGGFFLRKPDNYVDLDVATGLMIATRHLIQAGHRRIAYVSHTEQSEKLNGYIIAMTKAKIPIRKEWILEIGFTEKALQETAESIHRMDPRPTALVFTSDAVAIRMMRIFRELGVRIPHDLSVTGFDNIETAGFVTPGLTTVRVPTRKIADLAVRHLVGLVEKNVTRQMQTMLSAELVVRESTAPLANVIEPS
ncbi:MAG TPA: LacI family DNA-binding transcriptional regulator [Kiritimatiellia bacterium]|nr:LacI family DNA-binding transcriptional regulator [Kiritimatiellia bacterium]HMO99519.1 LacI family DNA-binding transcriptional regulator [Kiritimatiellia bacterium]HMP97575.1 LacI family DNA-binding transcriptional regulator [Kiritimatiellia bacterium]